MTRTRITIDAIVIDGARDAGGAVAAVRKQIGSRVQMAVNASVPAAPAPENIRSIAITTPPEAASSAIGDAAGKAVAGALGRGKAQR